MENKGSGQVYNVLDILSEIYKNLSEVMSRIADTIVEWGIYALIIFTPLAFGSVHIWAYTILELCIFAFMLIWTMRYFSHSEVEIIIPESRINLLFGFFIAFVFIQMIPVPFIVLKYLSPDRYHLYNIILPKDGFKSISICVHQTKLELFKFIAYISAFFLVLNIFNSRKKIKRIILAILIAGIIEAFLGIFQLLTKSNKIFWLWQSVYKKGGYFGSFINPNHFAAYMGFITCVGIGLLISRLKVPFYPSNKSWRHHISRFESYISKNILLIFFLTIMGASIFLSLSRGGILCFLFTLILIFTFQWLRVSKKKVLIIITGLIFAFLIWIGIDPVIKELSTLLNLSRKTPKRAIVWKDSLKIIEDYTFLGVGFGNFRNIFPLYKSFSGHSFWDHAHNEYVEYLVDTGIVGFSLFYGAVFLTVFILIKKWLKRNEVFSVGITLGGISAIFLLLMSNMVTFNLHVPAIAFLFFIILAVSIRSVYLYHHIPLKKIVFKRKKGLFVIALFLSFIIFISISQLCIFQGWRYYNCYKKSGDIRFLKKAIQLDSSNAAYHYALAQEYFKDMKKYGNKALKECLRAIKLNPTNPWYHLGLAWVYYVMGDRFASKKELFIAVKLDSTNPLVKSYIKKWKKYAVF